MPKKLSHTMSNSSSDHEGCSQGILKIWILETCCVCSDENLALTCSYLSPSTSPVLLVKGVVHSSFCVGSEELKDGCLY